MASLIDRADGTAEPPAALPKVALALGYAGLLPQLAAVAMLASGRLEWRFTALALAYAYAALILSFLGGLWWGLAAQARAPTAPSIWVAAVSPSLIGLVSAVPWAIGDAWPGPSLVGLGLSLIGSLLVDRRLVRLHLAPDGWMRLRLPLSIGLGGLTLIAALL